MTSGELICELRHRADVWLNDETIPSYWRGYANGLREAANAIEQLPRNMWIKEG